MLDLEDSRYNRVTFRIHLGNCGRKGVAIFLIDMKVKVLAVRNTLSTFYARHYARYGDDNGEQHKRSCLCKV